MTARAPSRPPVMRRSLHLTRKQWIGLPLLVAIPVLTLLGVFGESRVAASAESPSIQLTAQFPARFRYRQVQPLRVTVRNRTSARLDTVTVTFDTAYIGRFSIMRFDPAPVRAYDVRLTDINPGETRLVALELWGEGYGRHPGTIAAATHADTARVAISTFVFP